MATSDQFRADQIAMTGAAVALTAIPKSVVSVVLKNRKANTGNIYLKEDNTVSSSNGYELAPGESISIDILNPGRMWAIGTNLERLCWATVKAG
jgi:hypothetical protein